MIEVTIPGRGTYRLEHLVLDVNGTLALDGQLLPGVAERLAALRQSMRLHLLSADTHGGLDAIATYLAIPATRLRAGEPEDEQKATYVQQLGADAVVAIGNGANDVGMLRASAIGIAVLGPEGLATEALLASDVLTNSILEALDLLLSPRRLAATLRR